MAQQPLLPSLFGGTNSPARPGSSAPQAPLQHSTFVMAGSPARPRKASAEGYKPKIITTVGARPACLVNASVTYTGNNEIYAFGGFDQFTDEGKESDGECGFELTLSQCTTTFSA